jgi:branched-chain amino acid transport system ATP-binding protein
VLELIDVHTYYGESHILHGISLKAGVGSVVALLGRNGMGKTTAIHSIIGFTPPRQGVVCFKGENIISFPSYRIAAMGIGLVPQGRRIFSSLSVKENLTITARSNGKADDWTLELVYSLFPILKRRAKSKGNLLSGGEQQMLCIGRALMTNPVFLLMDEPSEGLAPLIVQDIGHTIDQFRKDGLSILLVEQNLSMALGVSDYVYVLNKGVIVYESTPEELRSNKEVQAKYLAIAK